MSKQSEAKERQGWVAKSIHNCANCQHFTSDVVVMKGPYSDWTRETNVRCGKGAFKTGKASFCNDWAAKI